MPKKSFKSSPVLNFITTDTYDDHEKQNEYETHEESITCNEQEPQKIETGNTQGFKGKKLPRLNVAFYNNNLDYVQKIAGVKGISATAYINNLISEDKEKNKELYEKIKNLSNQIK